jgi:hypothetical protein
VGLKEDIEKLNALRSKTPAGGPISTSQPGKGNISGTKAPIDTGRVSTMPVDEVPEERWVNRSNTLIRDAGLASQNVLPIQGQQNELMGALQQRAMGQGVSPAELALRAQQERNLSGAIGQQHAMKNPLLAQHLGNQILSQQNAGALQQAQAMRGQEVMGANSQLIQAGQAQQQMQQNYALNLQKIAQQYEMMGWDQEKSWLLAQQQMQGLKAAKQRQDNAQNAGLLGGLFSAGGAIVGGIYGGPGGAVAGGTVGGAIGQGIAGGGS